MEIKSSIKIGGVTMVKSKKNVLRMSAEEIYKEELTFLRKNDDKEVPVGWKMSPKAVLTYVNGGEVKGRVISPKYIGNKRIVEICIATLLTDRALLLVGEPGTAKSWLSEHLTAAIYGDSTKVVQGTAGTTEEQIKYSWNYGMLIANGPSDEAMIKSPVCIAMESGGIARIEEISRCASEVQDSLISILSEKRIAVPELSKEIIANKGFSVIATANTRDKGVNTMSSALKRRFNIVVLPTPSDIETEIEIVEKRVSELSQSLNLNTELPSRESVEKLVTIFRELREGQTLNGNQKVKTVSGVLSTAEAISVLSNSMALTKSFGDGKITDYDLASSLMGAVIKDEEKDTVAFKEYLNNVIKKRGESYKGLYDSLKELVK